MIPSRRHRYQRPISRSDTSLYRSSGGPTGCGTARIGRLCSVTDAAGTTTHYVYGLNGLLYGEYDNSGDLIREYVYLDSEPLAQVDDGSPEVLTYLHTDHLGTPRFGTNSGGTQVWAWASDAFGVGAPTGSATVNLRMPGQYFDAESGLFYNWNRYYNPATGRYISSDPIGIEGGLNTFLYAEASPVMYVDPEGLQITIPYPPVLIPSFICAATPGCVEGVVQAAQNTIEWCQQKIGQIFSNESEEEKEKRCAEEWEFARRRCSDIFVMPPSQRPPGIWGGSLDQCIRGQVSQSCGGNRVN